MSGWLSRHVVDLRECPDECRRREQEVIAALNRCPARLRAEVEARLMAAPRDPNAPRPLPTGCTIGSGAGSQYCQYTPEQVREIIRSAGR